MRALLDHAPIAKDDHVVRTRADRGKPMHDDKERAPVILCVVALVGRAAPQRVDKSGFGQSVGGGGRLVGEQKRCILTE